MPEASANIIGPLPDRHDRGGTWIGRAWDPEAAGPCLVTIRDETVVDVTSPAAPTVRDLLELEDPAGHLAALAGRPLGRLDALAEAARAEASDRPRLLAPCDLQAVKACGVTFAGSMVERVIEERAAGDPAKAEAVRNRIAKAMGASLRDIVPGSEQAMAAKSALIDEGLWSQYLEVGIGPDAEVFTKAQPMSSVGWGATIGLHPRSHWNNPEPEIVLALDSRGRIRGATLGNDVNLRDFEGRSALLLPLAKDNNASCAIGPFIRLIDETFTLDDVRAAELAMVVEGRDGFRLEGHSSMREISRDPAESRGADRRSPSPVSRRSDALSRNHVRPGRGPRRPGARLYAPSRRPGDDLGARSRRPRQHRRELATEAPEWTFGTAALMRNLAARGLLLADGS